MNSRVLANISIKVVAIYLMAQGIMMLPSLVSVVQYSSSQVEQDSLLLTLMINFIISPFVVGLGLWLVSNKLSEIIIKEAAPDTEEETISIAHIQMVAISTIGLILLVLSIPQLVSMITQLFGGMIIENGEKVFDATLLSYFLATIVKIILALTLMLRASGWVRILYKIRGLGLK